MDKIRIMEIADVTKQFVEWTKKKIRHHVDTKVPIFYFREKEVWWTALGHNVGFEANGKHELFERPVLILKKYSKDMCFVLPLTTQMKSPSPWYQYTISIEGVNCAINVSQGRTISNRRLLRKMTTLDSAVYNEVVHQFTGQFA